MDWVGVAALVVAIAGGFLNWKHNRATERDAKKALETAEEATTAAVNAAEQQTRMADAMERMAQRDESSRAQVAHVQGSPSWAMTHSHGRIFEIENNGAGEAYDVELESENTLRFELRGDKPDPWRPGEAVQFFAAGSWQTISPIVRLSWRDSPDGERKSWVRPLPPSR